MFLPSLIIVGGNLVADLWHTVDCLLSTTLALLPVFYSNQNICEIEANFINKFKIGTLFCLKLATFHQ